jgi:Domain of unknown function (DUF4402)
MNKFKKIVLCGVLICGWVESASAQIVTNQSEAQATVVKPLVIANVSPLNFGKFSLPSPNVGQNTIVIDPNTGNRAISGAGNGSLIPGASSRALYNVTGEPNLTFSINAPNFTLQPTTGNALQVSVSPSVSVGTLDGLGNSTFGVGGTITFNHQLDPGIFRGNLIVSIAYN